MRVPYTVHDAAGRILRSGHAPSEAAARQQGEHVLIGVVGDDATQIIVGGALVDGPPAEPTLAEAKAGAIERIEREAAANRRRLMPVDRVLVVLAEAVDDPAGPARQALTAWRSRMAAIEAARERAVVAVEAAATAAGAQAAAAVDWNPIT